MREMLRILVLAQVAAAALLLGAAASASAGTLDQQQVTRDGFSALGMQRQLAQSFTAGLTGGLDQVDVSIWRQGFACTTLADITVEIRTVSSSGAPSDTALATASIPSGSVPNAFDWRSATFAAPASVTAGTQYALVLSSLGSNCTGTPYAWGDAGGNLYGSGGAWLSDPGTNGGAWTPRGANVDQTFRTYVVPPPPSPPPSNVTCRGRPVTIAGTNGPDNIVGTSGPDVIAALAGNDTASGLGGNDLICGGAGRDKLRGGGGADTLLGEAGKDTLKGGGAKDVCKGGKGDDSGKCEVEKSI